MAILDPAVDAFLLAHVPDRDDELKAMEAWARERRFPIVGPAVGALLEVLARSIGARRILEMGSGFGYSAAWWLRGMPPDGTVVLTDLDPDLVARGTAHLERLGHRGRFRYAVGEAIETLRRAHGPFDVVYCDVDKEGYPDVVEPAVERLRPGGLLVTDNASPPNSRADEVGAASCARAWRGARRRFDARRHASSAPRRGARTRGRRVRRAPGRNPRAPTGA